MDQQILALRTFVSIVDLGSFTKAASTLHLPRATATKLIQDLESHVGVKLLQRTTRRLSVTAEGAAYYERASRLVSEVEEMDAAVGRARTQLSGRIRVDVGSSLANMVIIPALPTFLARHPQIEVDLGVSDRTVHLIEEGVDCVIRGGDLPDTSLVARKLASLPYLTCASRAYLKRSGRPIHPRDLGGDLQKHVIVHYASTRTGRKFPLRFERGQEAFDIAGRSSVTVNESTAHLTTLLAGLGVGQTFAFMAKPHLDSGALKLVLPEWTRPPQAFNAVYPPNRHLNAKVRAFIDWAAELFAERAE